MVGSITLNNLGTRGPVLPSAVGAGDAVTLCSCHCRPAHVFMPLRSSSGTAASAPARRASAPLASASTAAARKRCGDGGAATANKKSKASQPPAKAPAPAAPPPPKQAPKQPPKQAAKAAAKAAAAAEAAAESYDDDEDDEDENEDDVPVYKNTSGLGSGYMFKDGTFVSAKIAKDVAKGSTVHDRHLSGAGVSPEQRAALLRLLSSKVSAAKAGTSKGVRAAAPAAAKTKAAGKQAAKSKPAATRQPASSVVQPSPSKMSANDVADETLRLARGGGEQHRAGEVVNRAACCIKACGNANARFGCRLCGIHLCSPECWSAHAYDNAELRGTRCAKFRDVSTFKEKRHCPQKAHRKAAAPAPTGRSAGGRRARR